MTKNDLGCLPLSQKIRKFQFKVKWKGNFPENPFGNCGLPPEVVLFFRSERNVRNFLTICFNFPFPGPFQDLRAVLVVFQYGSLMVSAISSGWSAYLENPLPLCNGHTNRIFLTNVSTPGDKQWKQREDKHSSEIARWTARGTADDREAWREDAVLPNGATSDDNSHLPPLSRRKFTTSACPQIAAR